MANNTQSKKKKNAWGLAAIPVLPLIIALFFLWTWFQPQSVDTSEGLQILKEAQIERVSVNDGTQQVNLMLKDPWTHKAVSAALDVRSPSPTRARSRRLSSMQ